MYESFRWSEGPEAFRAGVRFSSFRTIAAAATDVAVAFLLPAAVVAAAPAFGS